MPVHQMERSLGGIHNRELCAAWFASLEPKRYLVAAAQRPAREDEIAIAARLEAYVELIKMGFGIERVAELSRLIVVPRPRHMTVDLLEADQVGVLGLDDLDDSLEAITAIAT